MPGYCVQGTVGHKILNGQKKLEMEGRATVIIGTANTDFNWSSLDGIRELWSVVYIVHRFP